MFSINSPIGLFEPVDLSKLSEEKTALSIEGLDLHYGHHQALYNINMKIAKGQVTAFIGPSGCGKSTLLRCINRMNELVEGCQVSGRIMLHGRTFTTVRSMWPLCAVASAWCFSVRTRFRNPFMRT